MGGLFLFWLFPIKSELTLFSIISRNRKEDNFFSIRKHWLGLTTASNAMITLGNSLELPVLFKSIGWRLVFASFSRKAKLSSRLNFLKHFSVHLLKVTKNHGPGFTVKYLKACQLAVQRCIAGSPVSSLKEIAGEGPFPYLDNRGLPRIIPVYDRSLIKSGSASVTRYWLTLFSLYRVIKVDGTLKLGTITDPLSADEVRVSEIGGQLATIVANYSSLFPKPLASNKRIELLEASSSSHKVSWTGLINDISILNNIGQLDNVERMLIATQSEYLLKLFNIVINLRGSTLINFSSFTNLFIKDFPSGGQLSLKEEAAGKVRVFAMVDTWTQLSLRPLHDSIFSFLKSLPNDGTFNQRLAVLRCFSKVKKYKCSYGFDLSAATDRLPISIQFLVLSQLFGYDFAKTWKELLTDRDYVLPKSKYGPSETLRYSVGQPMGALSSWGMLALTHHLIVQLAARLSNRTHIKNGSIAWFDAYELLGDDIVIFDKLVADRYLSLMKDLGVEINLSKSVICRNGEVFEFAKVTGYNGKDVSALPWKAFMSQNSIFGRANIAYSLLTRRLGIVKWVSWLSSFTYMKKNNQKVVSTTLLAIFSMFANTGIISMDDVMKSLRNSHTPWVTEYSKVLLNANLTYVKVVLSSILLGRKPVLLSNLKKGVKLSYELDMVALKNGLVSKYQALVKRNPERRINTLADQMCFVLLGCPDWLKKYNKSTFAFLNSLDFNLANKEHMYLYAFYNQLWEQLLYHYHPEHIDQEGILPYDEYYGENKVIYKTPVWDLLYYLGVLENRFRIFEVVLRAHNPEKATPLFNGLKAIKDLVKLQKSKVVAAPGTSVNDIMKYLQNRNFNDLK